MISFIWAEDKQHVIGKNGTIPWHLPDDLQYFKKQTLNHNIIMGRKTFESMNSKALPDRNNIVLTRDTNFNADNVQICNSIDDVNVPDDENNFVIGGRQIFQEYYDRNIVDRLYVTKIHSMFNGGTEMIDIDYSKFQLVKRTPGKTDAKNKWRHDFEIYQKK